MLQEDHAFSPMYLLHSALVACNLHLLTGFISTQWQDIVHVLLAHPKVQVHLYSVVLIAGFKTSIQFVSIRHG